MVAHSYQDGDACHRSQDLAQHPELIAMAAVLHDVTGIDDEIDRIVGMEDGDLRHHLLPLPVREGALIAVHDKSDST